MLLRFGLGAAVVVAATMIAGDVAAQDAAAGEALFNRGLADMEAGKFDTACPALGESYRLDPRAGTLFTVAECEAKAGHLATAVVRYDDYLSLYSRLPADQQAKQKDRPQRATAQKTALGPLVPQLTLVLAANAPKGTIVKRDDVALSGPSLGIALPVDPGAHLITTQAPGGAIVETKITIAKGEKKTVTVDPNAGATAPPATGAALAPTAPSDTSPPPPPPSSSGMSGRRTAALVVGGVGVIGLGVGIATGAITLGKKSTIDDNCAGTACNQDGKSAADSAKTTGLVSTIGFIAGVACVGAAVVLIATEPKKTTMGRVTPGRFVSAGVLGASDKGATMGLRGAW